MDFISLNKLAGHTKRTPRTIRGDAQIGLLTPIKKKGIRAAIFTVSDVNRYLSLKFPELPKFPTE